MAKVELREGILALALEEGEIIETPNKLYIAYRHGRNFCEIQVQNRALKITLDVSLDTLNDPEKIARDVSNVGHWSTGDVQFKLETVDRLEYALSLISQAYQQTK